MINNVKSKITVMMLAIGLLSSNLCSGMAEAKSWEFDDNPSLETMPLQPNYVNNGDSPITLSLRDTDVRQVLRMFADKAGLNIVFIGNINATVTLDLVDTTLQDAINIVTEASNVTFIIDNNTMVVMNVAEARNNNYAKKAMRVVPIKYTDASVIAKFLNQNVFGLGKPGLSTGDIVVTNPSKNEIIIFGTENDYEMAMSILRKLDVKPNSTTYKINHVTPKEMATLICDSLFQKSADAETTKLAGVLTGAAATQNITLGAGTIACKLSSSISGSQISSFATPPITVLYNTNLGTINILGGSKEQIQLINDFILMHDKKQPQAILEFAVLELNEKGSQSFSNEWHFPNDTFPVAFQNGTLSLGSIIFFGQDNNSTTGMNKGGDAALWDTISWVEETGKGRLLQKPTIIVTNGAESVIDLTQDYIEKTDQQVSETSGSTFPIISKTYTIGKDQGIKISITPFISPDGYVTMNIQSDYATPYARETNFDARGNEFTAATLLERRNLTLNSIRVKDGETIVLGGLIYESETQKVAKIPILGDIPGLGVFFRNTNSEKNKNELVIIITPRIVQDTEDAVDI